MSSNKIIYSSPLILTASPEI